MTKCAIGEETRRIKRIVLPEMPEGQSCHEVGKGTVAFIETVSVAGCGGWYPWFIVTYQDGFVRKCNSLHVADVEYFPVGKD